MLFMWVLTVPTVTVSYSAISEFDMPAANNSNTSCSRVLRGSIRGEVVADDVSGSLEPPFLAAGFVSD